MAKFVFFFVFLSFCGVSDAFTSSSPLAKVNTRVSIDPTSVAQSFVAEALSSSSLSAAPVEIIEPSYNLALGSLALGAAFGVPGSPLKSKLSAFLGGIPLTLFGLFLAFQTTTLRFTFDDKNFALLRSNLESTGENVVVGGENAWAYDKFVNYDLFPSRSFPILVYFKETQTPEEFWNVGPGEQANSPEAIAKGAIPGQVHFFPAIGNTEDLIKGFENHGCAKIEQEK
mmetsp:Transcript_10618/g.21849  ORF Transcript_10618/g.21849 Transcript_10618/m.21849 type:complete len:228 (+) Transcript_10618:58-741(+)